MNSIQLIANLFLHSLFLFFDTFMVFWIKTRRTKYAGQTHLIQMMMTFSKKYKIIRGSASAWPARRVTASCSPLIADCCGDGVEADRLPCHRGHRAVRLYLLSWWRLLQQTQGKQQGLIALSAPLSAPHWPRWKSNKETKRQRNKERKSVTIWSRTSGEMLIVGSRSRPVLVSVTLWPFHTVLPSLPSQPEVRGHVGVCNCVRVPTVTLKMYYTNSVCAHNILFEQQSDLLVTGMCALTVLPEKLFVKPTQ